MLTCLLVGLQTASYKAVNFDKLRLSNAQLKTLLTS
jgi:hypothetical protein